MRLRLTYSNVVATLALIIAVGGASAFAATQLAKNSVGSKQLKKNAVTTVKLKNGAVTAAKLKAGTLPTTPTTVPSADHAASASTAGNGAKAFSFHSSPTDLAPPNPSTPGMHAVLDLGELSINASCIGAGSGEARVYVTFSSSVAASVDTVATQFNNPGTVTEEYGFGLAPGTSFEIAGLTGANEHRTGEWIYESGAHNIGVMLNAKVDQEQCVV